MLLTTINNVALLILLLYCCYVVCENLDLLEGSPCSWKNVTGQCVSVYRCFNAMEDIKNKDHPPICTYKDEVPIICCTDCKLVKDTRLIIIDRNLGILEKTGTSKANDKCVEYINSVPYYCKWNSIVSVYKEYNHESKCYDVGKLRLEGAAEGGRNAFRDEYGHMALLGYGDSVESAQWLCGGSVISERFILTAGHCLSSPSLGPVNYITLGILRRSDTPDLWQRYNVKRAIPYPEYEPPSKYHDIALLETDKEITFGRRVRPACLHVDGEEDDVADATGWGALGYKKSLADTLQSVTLNKFSEEQCSMYYPEHRHLKHGYNHTTQMCYGNLMESKDTCEGDSGGPLQSDRDECVYKILGVTSHGIRCGLGSSSGIYTRVSYYVPWIEDIVWP